MADRNLSRAHVGLALASALVVLLASVVAISRLGDSDDEGVSTSTSGATSSTAGAESTPAGSGPATAGGSGSSAAGAPGGTAQPAGAADALATAAGAGDPGGTSSAAKGPGALGRSDPASTAGAGPSGRQASAAADGSESSGDPAGTGAGSADGGAAGGSPSGGTGGGPPSGGGSGRDGQEAPPQPGQDRPAQKPLLVASASVGQGAQGGVVGVTLDGGSPELDVTVGTDQVVGNHPPSQGTGVTFGGRFLNPPPTVPLPPG